MGKRFSSIDAAIDAIASGEIIIVVDAEDRENEGDFLAAADKMTTEMVHFMITFGRGHLCMPIAPDVDVMKLSLPYVLKFLATAEPEPGEALNPASAAAPAAG